MYDSPAASQVRWLGAWTSPGGMMLSASGGVSHRPPRIQCSPTASGLHVSCQVGWTWRSSGSTAPAE